MKNLGFTKYFLGLEIR